MRKFPLIIVAAFIVNNIYATIRTVSNNPSTIGQFNDIQAAIDASSNGDTVYVHGSPSGYASFTITNKRIVILGPGWAPNKNLPLKAVVPGCTITGAASSNTEIQGLDFTANVSPGAAVTDLHFIRNFFESNVFLNTGTFTGYIFEGNIFTLRLFGTSGAAYVNMLVQNNYFYSTGNSVNDFVNCTNVIFNHNLWFGPASGSADCFSNCQSLILTNNVFVRRNAATTLSNSTFNNNITFNAGNNNPWAVNGNIDGGGNVANQDPQMVAEASVDNGTNDPTLDFTIAAGPANNSGNDGKDMGLLYNVSPDPRLDLNWTISRSSRLPFVFSMNIVNPVIGAGGSLNVNVEARKNN